MKYPLNPKERIGLIVLSCLILANIGWILVRKRDMSGPETHAPVRTTIVPSDSTTAVKQVSDTMVPGAENDRRKKAKSTRRKKTHEKAPSHTHVPPPRDFLRDTIPTSRR